MLRSWELEAEIRLLTFSWPQALRLYSWLPPLIKKLEAQGRLCPSPIADVTPFPGPEGSGDSHLLCAPGMSLRSQEPPCSCCWSPPVHGCLRGTVNLLQWARGTGTRWKPDPHLGGVGPGTCLCQLLAGPPGGPSAWSQEAPAQDTNYGFHREADDLIRSIPEHRRCPSLRLFHLDPGKEYLAYLPSPTMQWLRFSLSHQFLPPRSQLLHPARGPATSACFVHARLHPQRRAAPTTS